VAPSQWVRRMSAPGRPKREYRSAQHEGTPRSAPGRPKGEYRSAQHEGTPVSRAPRERRQDRPVGAYLVRVVQERVETVRLRFEMVELASGERFQFKTLAALNRHLRAVAAVHQSAAAEPTAK
jgi:hypothetical protein